MSTIREIVDNPHPIYLKNCDFWNFLLDSYEGGKDYSQCFLSQVKQVGVGSSIKMHIFGGGPDAQITKAGNLFMHPKERSKDYADRIAMSYYYNFCAPIIDIYSDHLFKQPVNEDFGSIKDLVDERRDNIDNRQGSIGEFRKDMADLAQIYGHVFVVTDSVNYEGDVLTMADVFSNNLLPYFTTHHPQNVMNWSLDEFGSPFWVLVRESTDGNPDPFAFDKERRELVRYRLWTRQEWILYDADYNEMSRGTHGLGVVPITCVFDKKSKKASNFLGISAIADIALVARDVYNSCSELRQILRDQTFAFLALQGNSDEYNAIEVGTSKGLLYPVDRAMPAYVSPPSSNAEVYFQHIDRQITKMFQLAKLEGGSVQPVQQSAVEQSGVSKAWDFNQTNSALSKKAGNLEDGETKLWQIFALAEGREFDGSVEYPHEFSVTSLMDDLNEAEKMMRLELGELVNQEVKTAIIKKKFPRMAEEEVEKLINDMKQTETTASQGLSGSILNRVPSFNRFSAAGNANSGGK